MLVLTRKVGQEIIIPSLGATIKVIAVSGQRTQLGVVAPITVRVARCEVFSVESSARLQAEPETPQTVTPNPTATVSDPAAVSRHRNAAS